MKIETLTTAEVRQIGLAGNGWTKIDILEKKETINIGAAAKPDLKYHLDWGFAKAEDAQKALKLNGGKYGWQYYTVILHLNGGRKTYAAIHLMPHGIRIGTTFKVMGSSHQVNATGDHLCLHFVDTMDVQPNIKSTNQYTAMRALIRNAASKFGSGQSAPKPAPVTTPKPAASPQPAQSSGSPPRPANFVNSKTGKHKVLSGHHFNIIAREYGISHDELRKLNPKITNPNDLQIGQEVNVPKPK